MLVKSGLDLTVFPDGWDDKKYTHLDVASNNIDKFPDTIGGANHLTWLDVGYNQITEIPKEIEKLTNLKELRVNGNKNLSSINNIENLSNLTYLSIRSTNINSLPTKICERIKSGKLTLDIEKDKKVC